MQRDKSSKDLLSTSEERQLVIKNINVVSCELQTILYVCVFVHVPRYLLVVLMNATYSTLHSGSTYCNL